MKTVAIIAISVGVSVTVLGVLIGISAYQQAELETIFEEIEKIQETPTIDPSQYCSGNAACFAGNVTRIVDGDTIHVDGNSIRFALASTPELNEFGGLDAKHFVEQICPVGSEAVVDEDDNQTLGSYGRMIAVIYCNGVNLNEAVLDAGHAWLSLTFCSRSEFSSHAWAQNYGCGTPNVKPPEIIAEPTQQKVPAPGFEDVPEMIVESDCDPSYPDVCIPPWPPDLDCGEISYRNFYVLPDDPHGFDGDKDGIGCES